MKPSSASTSSARLAMTLLEMLVALTVFIILLLVSFRLIEQASSAWRFASSKVEQFRETRGGLGLIDANLRKATLDEYLGYEFDSSGYPTKWGRRSELRFISGPSAALIGSSGSSPTHAVFFTAPLGVTTNSDYQNLSGLLNICGYFIEWSNKDADRPDILPASQEYRFRLMQFLQPAEEMTLYADTATTSPQFTFKPTPGWQKTALQKSQTAVRSIADNVIAMIVEPITSTDPNADELTSDFSYDSAASSTDLAKNPRNRLPPAIRITLYTIDEPSAKRLEQSSTMPDIYGSLFTETSKLRPTGGDPGDFSRFEDTLNARHLRYNRKEIVVELVPRPWSKTDNL
jgi:uncharacterized protein (TIGR02599 family)